jgi:hypothetical protein
MQEKSAKEATFVFVWLTQYVTHIRPDDRVPIQRLNRDRPERTEISSDGFQPHLILLGLNEIDYGNRTNRVASKQSGSPCNEACDEVIVVPVRN